MLTRKNGNSPPSCLHQESHSDHGITVQQVRKDFFFFKSYLVWWRLFHRLSRFTDSRQLCVLRIEMGLTRLLASVVYTLGTCSGLLFLYGRLAAPEARGKNARHGRLLSSNRFSLNSSTRRKQWKWSLSLANEKAAKELAPSS